MFILKLFEQNYFYDSGFLKKNFFIIIPTPKSKRNAQYLHNTLYTKNHYNVRRKQFNNSLFHLKVLILI